MERNRGANRGRSSTTFRGGSSSNPSSRNFDGHIHQRNNSQQSSHHHEQAWTRSNGANYSSKDYNSGYSLNSTKRKYESSPHQDLRKSLNHHGANSHRHERKSYHEEVPRKRFQTETDYYTSQDGRGHHSEKITPKEYGSNRNVTYHGGSSHHQHHDERRFEFDNRPSRRVAIHGSGSSYLSGHHSSVHNHHRGGSFTRGRGRGSGRPHYSQTSSHKSKRETSDPPESVATAAVTNLKEKAAVPTDPLTVKMSSPETVDAASNQKADEPILIKKESSLEMEKPKVIKEEADDLDRTDEVELTLTEEDAATTLPEEGDDGDNINPINSTDQPPKVESDSDRSGKDSVHDRSRSKSARSVSPKRKAPQEPPDYFIRLQCPHCNQRAVTFREYISHLSGQRHAESLRKISIQHRMSLAKLRTRQRKEQKQIEAQSSRTPHSTRMNFCAICKLYHSESRPNHEATELHKIIKNFLMPYCPICRASFKTRMLYEKHVATLTHIRSKASMEKAYEKRRSQKKHQDDKPLNANSADTNHEEPVEEDEVDVDLNWDNFMIVDAVGSDADGDGDRHQLEDVAVGEHWVKKVEILFCDVCQRYLNRMEPLEKALDLHCRSRAHHLATEEHQQDKDRSQGIDSSSNVDESADHQDPIPNGLEGKGKNGHDEETEAHEMKRSESEEQLFQEAEKDIGVCDINEDATTAATATREADDISRTDAETEENNNEANGEPYPHSNDEVDEARHQDDESNDPNHPNHPPNREEASPACPDHVP